MALAYELSEQAPDPLAMEAAELQAELQSLRLLGDRIEVRIAQLAARLQETATERDLDGSVCAVDWIRHHCKMSGQAASRAVAVGGVLPHVPSAVEAVRSGEIGFGHLTVLAPLVRAVVENRGDGSFEEGPMLALAREHSVSRFFYDVRHARHAVDEQGVLAEQQDAHERRRLNLRPCEDGMVVVSGLLDGIDGATLRTALEPLSRPSGMADTRSAEQRRADALIELTQHLLDGGVLPTHHGQRPHLQITASLETVMGLPGSPAGELSFAPPIHSTTVQRFACDSTVARILLDDRSNIIDAGRSRRIASPAQRRALEAVKDGCWFPDCDRPGSWCQVHHFDHWAKGGATDISRLGLLCLRHHRMLHEDGWQLARNGDGVMVAIPPPWRTPSTRRHEERWAGEAWHPNARSDSLVRQLWSPAPQRRAPPELVC